MSYDAIIIGSGLGGLSCGSYLATKGWKVLVIEKHSIAGGYASSFKRGDFTFDVSLHMLNGVAKGTRWYKFFEWCGIADRIEFQKLNYFGRVVFPEHDFRIPCSGLEDVIATFENHFPHEKAGIRSLFTEMGKIYEDQISFSASEKPLWIKLALFPLLYRSLFPVVKKTSSELLDKHLKDEKLKAIFYANWMFYGLPPSKLNITYGVLPNLSYWTLGAYYPKGGNQVIPNAFVEVIKENGGEVIFNREVSKIITEGRKAVGVETRKGESYKGNVIISNISPQDTFLRLLEPAVIPNKIKDHTSKMELSGSHFLVYLGLGEEFTNKLENKEDYEFFISDTYDHDLDYQWSISGEFEKASYELVLYSNADKTIAKGNKFIMGLTQFHSYEYWQKFENDYFSGNKEEYKKEKERVANILVQRAEQIIPNISQHIEVIEIATPLTFKRFTSNPKGASYGWANLVTQSNPLQRSPQKTPIKNLYLSSAWTFPGEGQTATVRCGYGLGKMLAGN